MSQIYYVVRARTDGSYLVARPQPKSEAAGFLLLFHEHYDALSYLNTHGGTVSDRFSVESLPASQLDSLLKRWDFQGVGFVQDPLLPRVEFLTRQTS